MIPISSNKVVSVSYELHIDSFDGRLVEQVSREHPLSFIFNTGSMLPSFEKNLAGLKVGNSFTFQIPCSEAYGEINPEHIINLPHSAFQLNDETKTRMLRVGNVVPMVDDDGHHFHGRIIEVAQDFVTVDFNHIMAGFDLFFKGEVTEVREPTAEELNSGQVGHSCNHCGKH